MSVWRKLAILLVSCASCSPAAEPRDVQLESGSRESSATHADASSSANAAQIRRAFPDAWKLSCTPRELKPEDTLVLRFAGAHGPYAEVVSPDGHFYFLAYPDELREIEAPLNSEVLAGSSTLMLSVRNMRGLKDAELHPIFVEDGVYTLIFGTMLEVDIEDKEYNAYCNVVYRSGR